MAREHQGNAGGLKRDQDENHQPEPQEQPPILPPLQVPTFRLDGLLQELGVVEVLHLELIDRIRFCPVLPEETFMLDQ